MTKSKWLLLEADLTLKQIFRALLRDSYNAEKGKGFEPLSKSHEHMRWRYIERVETKENVVDPFGNISEIQTIRYNIVKLRIYRFDANDSTYSLEIEEPARTTRPLIDALARALGHISIDEFRWPLLVFFTKLKAASPKAKIKKIKACGIPISESSVGKLEITSSGDAFTDFIKMFPAERNRIDKIRIDSPFIDAQGFLEISSNGLCTFDESSEDAVRKLILGTANV